MKIREWEERPGFQGGWYCRVRTLAKDEPLPKGAEEVPADTDEHDWQRGAR